MDIIDTTESQEEGEEEQMEEEEEEDAYEEEDEDENDEEDVQTRPRCRSQSPEKQESSDVKECASSPRRKRRTTSRLGHGAMPKEQETGGFVTKGVLEAVEADNQDEVGAEGSRPRGRRKRARREGSAVYGWLKDGERRSCSASHIVHTYE